MRGRAIRPFYSELIKPSTKLTRPLDNTVIPRKEYLNYVNPI